MKQTPLKAREINKQLAHYNLELSKKDQVVLFQDDEKKFITVNKEPSFFYYQDHVVPTLKYLQNNLVLKKITVDMGAIKFVINGADIMRPGITEIDEGINKEDFIVIVDVTNKKPLAVGIALLNSEDMKEAKMGKVIKNIHYVGDEIWNIN